LEQLQAVPLFEGFRQQALASHSLLADPAQSRRLLYESIRLMLSAQVYDVIAATQIAIDAAQPTCVNDVRASPSLVTFGDGMRQNSQELKGFLMRKLYRHPQVVQTMALAKQVVRELFAAYSVAPQEMQSGFAARSAAVSAEQMDKADAMRVVADYIAGMTDRFATREHERLTGQRLLP
jgi:dGTPase